MNSPHEFDIQLSYLQRERLREAAAERLAHQATHGRRGLRPRLAATLHALADRLDTQQPSRVLTNGVLSTEY